MGPLSAAVKQILSAHKLHGTAVLWVVTRTCPTFNCCGCTLEYQLIAISRLFILIDCTSWYSHRSCIVVAANTWWSQYVANLTDIKLPSAAWSATHLSLHEQVVKHMVPTSWLTLDRCRSPLHCTSVQRSLATLGYCLWINVSMFVHVCRFPHWF